MVAGCFSIDATVCCLRFGLLRWLDDSRLGEQLVDANEGRLRRAADERYAVIYIREEVEDLVLLSLVALDLLDRLANLTKVRGKTLRARFRYALTVRKRPANPS